MGRRVWGGGCEVREEGVREQGVMEEVVREQGVMERVWGGGCEGGGW